MTAAAPKTLAQALLAFQREAPPIHENSTASTGTFSYKYVSLAELMRTIRPLLAKHGLVLMQHPTHLNGVPALRTVLLHESGEKEEDTAPLIIAKMDSQGQGSAITYMRRYAALAILGLVADADDDGQAAMPARETTFRAPDAVRPASNGEPPSEPQQRKLNAIIAELKGGGHINDEQLHSAITNLGAPDLDSLSKSQASNLIGRLEAFKKNVVAESAA